MFVFFVLWSIASVVIALWALRIAMRERTRTQVRRAAMLVLAAVFVVLLTATWIRG